MSSKLFALCWVAVATMLPGQLHAAVLSFSQTGDGTISAVLDTGPCVQGPLPGTLAPTVSISGTEIDVSTGGGQVSSFFGVPFICDPVSYPGIMVKAPLGKLADGTYTVVWDYSPGQATGTFAVVDSALSSVYPPSVNGFWYDPTASGSGFNFEIALVGLLVTYYGRDASGNRLWLTSDFGPSSITPNVPITLNMSSTSGGTFTAPQHNLTAWGTPVVTFLDCRSASATLSGKDGTVNLNLSHLTSISSAPGC